jgi:hypothetical protein
MRWCNGNCAFQLFEGLTSRWMIPLLVRRFQRVGDLSRDWERLVQRNRSVCDAIGERLSLRS